MGPAGIRVALRSGVICAVLALTVAASLMRVPLLAAQAPWPAIELVSPVSGFDQPVFVTNAGDGSDRLYVVEQAGLIRIVRNGAILSAAFLDIRERVLTGPERGLLSVAFPPDYAASGVFYVYYTARAGDGDITVSRFRRAATDRADQSSEQVLLTIEHSENGNHNGGMMAFGPRDGFLYIATGDGGSANDPPNNAQNPQSLLGKLLRIDVGAPAARLRYRRFLPAAQSARQAPQPALTGAPGAASVTTTVNRAQLAYAIPATNPFVNRPGYRPEIWALGLRNPWRFSFDRETGDLYIGDVGQFAWEEVDWEAAGGTGGLNYGWRVVEGPECNSAYGTSCDTSGLVAPVAAYGRGEGKTVIGGYVYRGKAAPALAGIYLFGDNGSGSIWGLRRENGAWQRKLLGSTGAISSFGEDEAGEVYAVEYGWPVKAGTIWRVASD